MSHKDPLDEHLQDDVSQHVPDLDDRRHDPVPRSGAVPGGGGAGFSTPSAARLEEEEATPDEDVSAGAAEDAEPA